MKVFIDVGAHEGQTIYSVLDPKYSFDKIYSFEPTKICFEKIIKFKEIDARVIPLNFGLWNKNIEAKIFSPGSVEGSVFEDHNDVEKTNFELCKFVRASEWFNENITLGDKVYVKLNCEGAECDIIEDLIISGEISKISDVMIDFDVRKVTSQHFRQQEIISMLKDHDLHNYSFCEEVCKGPSHLIRIQHWLDLKKADTRDFRGKWYQFFYFIYETISGRRQGSIWEIKHFAKRYIPTSILSLMGARKK